MQSRLSTHTIVPSVKGTSMDAQEFQKFYQENFGLIYRFVYKKVGNKEVVEDLTSEIFLKAVSGLNPEHVPQSMQYWLYLIARTTIADYWRAHYRLPIDSLDELVEAGWEGSDEKEAIESSSLPAVRVQLLLQALPERDREVLTCRFLLKLSIKDTAFRMGLSVANVKVLQFRALKHAAELDSIVTEQQCSAV